MALVKFQGMKVRLPKRKKKLTEIDKSKILSSGQRLRKSEACTIVFFKGNPVQRCEGRKLRAHNKNQCVSKKGKFVKCPRGKRRRRR